MKLGVKKEYGIFGDERFSIIDWTLHPGKVVIGLIQSVISNMAKVGWKVGILQLDGGGILGVLTLYILYTLSTMGIKVMDRFKIFFTCSTGTIIGGLLQVWDVKKIFEWYVVKGPTAFKKNPFFGGFLWGTLYSPKEIEKLLRGVFGVMTLKQLHDKSGIDWRIAIFDVDAEETIIINWESHPDWEVVEAIICSMSAPIYFPDRKYKGKAWCDGGTGTHTCLAEEAYDHAVYDLKMDPSEFYLLSLGCGWAKTKGQGKSKLDMALWVFQVGRNESVRQQDEFFSDRQEEGVLFGDRWDPQMPSDLNEMDGTDNIDELISFMER